MCACYLTSRDVCRKQPHAGAERAAGRRTDNLTRKSALIIRSPACVLSLCCLSCQRSCVASVCSQTVWYLVRQVHELESQVEQQRVALAEAHARIAKHEGALFVSWLRVVLCVFLFFCVRVVWLPSACFESEFVCRRRCCASGRYHDAHSRAVGHTARPARLRCTNWRAVHTQYPSQPQQQQQQQQQQQHQQPQQQQQQQAALAALLGGAAGTSGAYNPLALLGSLYPPPALTAATHNTSVGAATHAAGPAATAAEHVTSGPLRQGLAVTSAYGATKESTVTRSADLDISSRTI